MSERDLLLLGGGRLARLREEVHDLRAHEFRRLLDQCDWYRDQPPPPVEHPTTSITYFAYAAANLALAYRLTGQPDYLEEARRWIFTPVGYPHWGKAHMPDHDLDAGWLTYGLGLAYDWLKHDLQPDEATRLRDKLVLQGRRLYDFAVESEGRWWSSSFWQNHNWICHAGLATAGYVLRDDYPETQAWTDRCRDNFRTILEMLPEDGSNCEGVVYWRYGVPWIVTYLDVLESAEGIDWFPDSPYLRETFWYRLYQAAPNLEEIVNHGDTHDRRSGHPVWMYRRLASKYRIPQAQWLADQVNDRFLWREAYESGVRPGILPEAFLELLWRDPTVEPEGPEALPTHRYFPDLGLVVARTGWDEDATLLSFKASPGGGHKAWDAAEQLRRERGWETLNAGHHHPDANAFVLISNGAHLAIDEGYANRKRAANHNLVLVDGQGFANEDRYHVYKDLPYDHQARVRDHVAVGGWVHAVGESAAMYPPELGVTQVDRHVVFTPSGRVLLDDRLAATEARQWTWLLHSDHRAEVEADGTLQVRKGRGRLRIHRLVDDGAALIQDRTEIFANPTSSTPSLAIETWQHTIRLDVPPRARQRFLTLLDAGFVRDQPAEVTPLTVDGGRGVRLTGPVTETIWVADETTLEGEGMKAESALVALHTTAEVSSLFVHRARDVRLENGVVLASSAPVSAAVQWTADGNTASCTVTAATILTVATPGQDEVQFRLPPGRHELSWR